MAIGIGANSVIFSVINGVLLEPLPYPQPDALIAVWQTAPNIHLKGVELSPSDYFILREQNRSISSIGVWSSGSVTITGKAAPEQVRTLWVTEATLATFGIAPLLGRAFTSKDTERDSPETVILTHAYWQQKFSADSSALGRRIVGHRAAGACSPVGTAKRKRHQVYEFFVHLT
jgi:hypothetical protein